MENEQYRKEFALDIERVIRQGPFKDTWESLAAFRHPKWFTEGKFGIFIHWGVFTVPEYDNEWYPRSMYQKGSRAYENHLKTFGSHTEYGYKDYVPRFTAPKFDAKAWADLFKEAGARFIVPVAEHHDGFQMYGSELSGWNAVDRGPKRNVLQEEKDAYEDHGMVFCCSSHRMEHWFFLNGGREFDCDLKRMADAAGGLKQGDLYWPSMPLDEEHLQSTNTGTYPPPTEEYLTDWLLRSCEIVDKYQPSLFYFDWWIQQECVKPYLRKFLAYYYNKGVEWGKEVAVAYKHDACAFGTAIYDLERGKLTQAVPYPWETDTAIARNSWCYTDSLDYKSAEEIIQYLADVVSKNGTLLLNVGPRADGTIAPQDTAILKTIGAWLRVNGEAIYKSTCWKIAEEGETAEPTGEFSDAKATEYNRTDFRFTVGNGAIYAIALKYPEDGHVTIKSLALDPLAAPGERTRLIRTVSVLGSDELPRWSVDADGLHVATGTVDNSLPIVLKITTE